MIRDSLFIVPFVICIAVASVFSQQSTAARLVGVWRLGYEDYGEFIYHKVEEFASSYLKENPNARMVARLCSSGTMPVALADSHGFAFALPQYAADLRVPANRIFFARWSRCEKGTEQYWFVPENGRLEYDELISAERVRVNRLNLKEFIAELKNNPSTEGFIILNTGMSNRRIAEALQQLRNEKVEKKRFQILRKRTHRKYYPEFMTVTITQ
jgi:hypothetical protein